MTQNTNIRNLKSLLYLKVKTSDDVQKIRDFLEKCDKNQLQSWMDADGYDILHHAIISNNIEAIGIMFAHGLYKPPHEPKRHSYIHLAANYGNKAVVAMLLQERPRDYTNNKTKYTWLKPPSEVASGELMTSPLDVAGDSGHVGCVHTILDFYSARNRLEVGSENYLSQACVCNSPSALRLLLKKRTPEADVKAAVGAALKQANAECLDILLKCNPNLTSLFSGMNLYHVLFSYSHSLKKQWYENLLTVTSVLLKHRQNPACAVPFRTYPLYSLLSHSMADFRLQSPYTMACMVVLLNAGVDPNFNEVQFERENESTSIQTAFGRSAYASAFHCVYDYVVGVVRGDAADAVPGRRYVTKCTETLLRHQADTNIIGPVGSFDRDGNALSAFLSVLLTLGVDERTLTTFDLLIQNGANPNCRAGEMYPINILLEDVLLNHAAFTHLSKETEYIMMGNMTKIVQSLLSRMTQSAAEAASKVEIDGKPTSELQRRVYKTIKTETLQRCASIDSLRTLCRLVILDSCDRRSTTVVQLPIPTVLKKFVNGISPV